MNSKAFYDNIRHSVFRGSISADRFQNMQLLVTEFRKYEGLDYRHLAYLLATVYHETAGTMKPLEEYGKGAKYPYGKMFKMGGGPSKRVAYSTPDHIYYGRGYVQVTWYENYERLSKVNRRGWDFLNKPELLLQPEPSAWAALYGMTTGMFTGKKLAHYINDELTDFEGARRIINGTDKAKLIANYSIEFYQALTSL